MKVVKVLLKVVLGLVAVVLLALLTLPLWFGPVVKTAANSVVPGIVKTGFHLGHLSLNPYTARFELGDLQLSNPAGYSEKYAATVGSVAFDAETFSLLTDVIHVEEITIKDVFASYVSGGPEKVNNFQQIQYNVAGGKEKYEAARAEKQTKAAQTKDKAAEKPSAEEPAKSGPEKKFVIDRLEVSGLMIQLGILPIRIPFAIVVKDIGRKSGGATAAEVGQQVWNEIMKAAGKFGDQFKALGGMMGDAAGKATAELSKATESANKAVGKATAELGKATESANKVVGKATEGVNKAFGATTEGANKAVGATADAVGNGAKAVGDGAKKALDSIKSLW